MRGQIKASKEIQKYLDLHGIPYLKLDGTINLLVMRANSSSHYAVIEFFEMSDDYYRSNKMKTFTFSRQWGTTKETIVTRLNNYLNN
jgi:uncharacterized protein (DUF1330 family)